MNQAKEKLMKENSQYASKKPTAIN